MKTLKNRFWHSVLVLASVIITLFVAEGITRFIKSNEGHYPQKDPVLHHSLVPNAVKHHFSNEFDVTYKINGRGFRDNDFSVPKPKNTYRILMLGDSFTFGKGVDLEQTFTKRLEKKLRQSSDSIFYEVINGGCSSYSPILEYLFLIHKGLAVEPDLVILNYDISDVQDDFKYAGIAQFDDEGKPVKVNPINVQWFQEDVMKKVDSGIPFLRHSKLYTLIVELVYRLKGRQDISFWYEKVKAVAGNIEYDRDLPMRENAGDWKKHFDHSATYLKMIANHLKELKIDFIITAYPYGTLVNADEWALGRSLRGFDKKVYTTKLFDYLAEFSTKNDIPFLNMLPDFQQSSNHPLFYSFNGHFTPAGHELAAQSLERFLSSYYNK